MLLTNSQNNIERSAIDSALERSEYDVLASKGESVQFDKKFGPLLTYCPADNLIYYIGYEHEPTGDIKTDKEVQSRVFGLDLKDSSPFNHFVQKYGGAFLDPLENAFAESKGSLSLSGEGDYLVIGCPDRNQAIYAGYWGSPAHNDSIDRLAKPFECPEIFGSRKSKWGAHTSRFPSNERGLAADGETTVEFWIKPREFDGRYEYQTIIQHGWNPTSKLDGGHLGSDDKGDGNAIFGVYLGSLGDHDWVPGKIYVRGTGGTTDANGSDYMLDLESTTILEEGTWYHIAIEKQAQAGADLVTLYINGTAEDTDNWIIDQAIDNDNLWWHSPTYIGVQVHSPLSTRAWSPDLYGGAANEMLYFDYYGYFNGHIDELRVSYKAMYKGDFDVQTTQFEVSEEYEDVGKVKMLLQGTGDTSAFLTDRMGIHTFSTSGITSPQNKTITSCDGPGNRCGYIHFHGGYTGLHTVLGTELDFSSSNPITIDFWYKFNGMNTIGDTNYYQDVIIQQEPTRYLELGWSVAMQQTGKIRLTVYDQPTTATRYQQSQYRYYDIESINDLRSGWHHIAITITPNPSSSYQGGDWRFYVDGKLQGIIANTYYPMPSGGDWWNIMRIAHGGCVEFGGAKGLLCHYGNFYLDDLRLTTDLRWSGEFSPPTTRAASSDGLDTSLMMHLDAQVEITETINITVEDGGYGLCTFNPLTLDTETVLKFDEPQYKDEDLGKTMSIADGCGDTWQHNRTYNIPRDIVYSAYDNCLWLLFNKHEQFYIAKTVCNPTEEYAGMDGFVEQYFSSRSRFILYKYDLTNRKITYEKSLWDISWNDDVFAAGWLEIALMKDVIGLNNKYLHYPEFIRHMFTSLSVNPRTGEVIALHSNKGWGYLNSDFGGHDYTYVEGGRDGTGFMLPPESRKSSSEIIVSAHCPTNKKCVNRVYTNDTNAIWGMDSQGESWHFTTRLNDGSDQVIPSANFSSNNCMVYTEPTGHISQETWTIGPCPDDPNETCSFISSISRPFETGGNPKKLIFCPSTGSYYIPSKSDDAWVDFLYEGWGGEREISDNFFLLSSNPASFTQDGIYVPSMDKILYLVYAGGQPGLVYINACRPHPESTPLNQGELVETSEQQGYCSSDGSSADQIIYGRNGLGDQITSAQSLIYCPSNDRIYLLGSKTLLKIRPFNLSVEESYTVPTGESMKEGMGLKTFIPVYSHVNDVIYYMSNDNQRQSFCFKPNY